MAKKIWNLTECLISVRPTDSKRGKRASQKSSEENSSTGRRASTKKGVRFKSLLSFIIQTSLFIASRKSRFSIRTFWVGRWGLGLRKQSWAVSCGTTRVHLITGMNSIKWLQNIVINAWCFHFTLYYTSKWWRQSYRVQAHGLSNSGAMIYMKLCSQWMGECASTIMVLRCLVQSIFT